MNQTKSSLNVRLSKPITKREREILELIAEHYTNKEIAESLHLALSTVKWYTRQIFNKLTVNNRREAVHKAVAIGLLQTEPAPREIPNNLPSPVTPFVGRESEVDMLIHLLINGDTRLVTLHAPGGNGKTRLAIQAAIRLIEAKTDKCSDGIWFVSLASLQSSDSIPQTIAEAMGYTLFERGTEFLQQLVDYIRPRNLILILDNFEHLISAESLKVITEINNRAPRVQLLITSRSRLNIYGEQLFPVTGLQIPQVETSGPIEWEHFSAIRLFLQCARRVQPTFEVKAENLVVVIQICQLVGGMPLGIELAASWLELLPLNEIAVEINRSLDFLETDQANLPERQRSIRAIFNSSWELLTDEEQQAFLRLCVVVGSFTYEAAQKITGTSLNTLLGLANKSWLQLVDGGKFQIHELMRQYGEEFIRTEPKVWQEAKARHASYYADLVADQALKMRGPDQIDGMITIDGEFDLNIKAAWEWLVTHNGWNVIVDKIILGLFHYVTIVKRFDDLLPLLRVAQLELAESDMGKFEQLAFAILGTLEVYCEEEFAILDDNPVTRLTKVWQLTKDHHLAKEMGFWYVMLAGLAHKKNIDSRAKEQLDESVEDIRMSADSWTLGISLMIQANWWLEFDLDEKKLLEASQIFDNLSVPYEQSYISGMVADQMTQSQKTSATNFQHYIEKSQLFYKRLGELHPRFIHLLYRYNSPSQYFQIGEFENGFAAFHEEQAFFEKTGHKGWLGYSLTWEGDAAIRYSTFEHALKVHWRRQELAKLSDNRTFFYWTLYETGEVYRVFNDHLKATELYEQAHVGFEKMNITLGLGYYQRAYGDVALQNAQYSNTLTHYETYMKYASEDNHLWSIAQAHGKLALALAYLGKLKPSRLELKEALTQARTWGKYGLQLQILLAEPVNLINQGKPDDAVTLSWFILNHRLSWNETKQHVKAILDGARRQLPPDIFELAKERGKNLILENVLKNYVSME